MKNRRSKHTWDLTLHGAIVDGRTRTCQRCGAQCERITVQATLTAPALSSTTKNVYAWRYRTSAKDYWGQSWDMPPCSAEEPE